MYCDGQSLLACQHTTFTALRRFCLLDVRLLGSPAPSQLHPVEMSCRHVCLYCFFDPPTVLISSIVPC